MGKSSSNTTTPRQLTQVELDLLAQQEKSLKQASDVAMMQYNLSVEDRNYITGIYRGDLDPQDPQVQAELARRLEDTPAPTRDQYRTTSTSEDGYLAAMAQWETDRDALVRTISSDLGDKGIDELLFEGILNSQSEASKLLGDWTLKTEAIGGDYVGSLSGISESFKQNLLTASGAYNETLSNATGKLGTELSGAVDGYRTQLATSTESFTKDITDSRVSYAQKMGEATGKYIGSTQNEVNSYKGQLQDAKGKIGTADADIYAQTKGSQLAGISQAYQEASKAALGQLSRRGLAGSGVEAKVIGDLAGQQAGATAGALSNSYQQAIAMSDQRRQQQLAMGEQAYNVGQAGAQSVYGARTANIQGQYGVNTAAGQSVYAANSDLAGKDFSATSGLSNTMYGANIDAAGTQYGVNANVNQQVAQQGQQQAGIAYGVASGLETSILQNNLNNQQQGLANLQMGAGVSSGTFLQSQNYLNQAGATSNTTAATAGNTASAYGQMDNAYQMNAQNNRAEADGAMLGAVSGLASTGMMMASDERLKTNIVLVGREAGHNIYTWDWIEGFDGGYDTGVLAQEVMDINPEAVSVMDNGYYGVDYDMIGIKPETTGV